MKTKQRALGAALGVLATGLLLLHTPPAWALAAGIGVLAGLRPLLRARNYLAYTAAMTPLIILLLDAGADARHGRADRPAGRHLDRRRPGDRYQLAVREFLELFAAMPPPVVRAESRLSLSWKCRAGSGLLTGARQFGRRFAA